VKLFLKIGLTDRDLSKIGLLDSPNFRRPECHFSTLDDHIRTFKPFGFPQILDFIHALQYAYSAAAEWEDNDTERWQRYLEIAEALWQGKVDVMFEQLQTKLSRRHVISDPETTREPESLAMSDAVRYFTNNRHRMD
jgi:hypothetical protein